MSQPVVPRIEPGRRAVSRGALPAMGLWCAGGACLAVIFLHFVPFSYSLGLEWTGNAFLAACIAFLALCLAPLTLPAMVLYSGLALGTWTPGIICLAGMLCMAFTGLRLLLGGRRTVIPPGR